MARHQRALCSLYRAERFQDRSRWQQHWNHAPWCLSILYRFHPNLYQAYFMPIIADYIGFSHGNILSDSLHPARYGQGAYLAEHCTKADEYSSDERLGFSFWPATRAKRSCKNAVFTPQKQPFRSETEAWGFL